MPRRASSRAVRASRRSRRRERRAQSRRRFRASRATRSASRARDRRRAGQRCDRPVCARRRSSAKIGGDRFGGERRDARAGDPVRMVRQPAQREHRPAAGCASRLMTPSRYTPSLRLPAAPRPTISVAETLIGMSEAQRRIRYGALACDRWSDCRAWREAAARAPARLAERRARSRRSPGTTKPARTVRAKPSTSCAPMRCAAMMPSAAPQAVEQHDQREEDRGRGGDAGERRRR